jgi:hypothetical protein
MIIRRAGGWTATLLFLSIVIGGATALVLFEMWSGSRDEIVHLPADETLTVQPAHSDAAVGQDQLASIDRDSNARPRQARPPQAAGVGVDAVSQAIKELHDASKDKAAIANSSVASPAYDLSGLSASSDVLVGRADKAADAADAARGAHASGAADSVRSTSERSGNHGR